MRTFGSIVLGVAAGMVAASLVVHRRVIVAMVKGEPLPEPPAWHKGHPCMGKCNSQA